MIQSSDFSDLSFALASIVDRNLGMKLIDSLVNQVKVVTVIDWNNLRVELEALVVALNRLNPPTAGKVLYILPELLDLSCFFLNKDIERVNDLTALKSRFMQLSLSNLKAVFRKFEVTLLGSQSAGVAVHQRQGHKALGPSN